MSLPKKHHYVAQMHLRRFADANGKLWYFDKRIPNGHVRSATPDQIFYQKHLYSIIEKDGTKDVSLENAFSQIESESNVIINKICDAARAGILPQLSEQERHLWDQYLYYQWKRTPDSLAKFTNEDDAKVRILELIEEFEETIRPLTTDERIEILSEGGLKRIFKHARVQAVADPGHMALDALTETSLGIVVPLNDRKSFIIGSNPVVKLTTDRETRIGKGEVEVWLPLAADVAICMIGSSERELLKAVPSDLIRRLNIAATDQSTVIAGKNKNLIASLANAR